MAIGWLTVLKTVPWGEVISNAPKVADGAKKLWGSVGRRMPAAEPVVAPAGNAATSQEPGLTELHARLRSVESAILGLNEQMSASAELIKSLADQNAELIAGLQRCQERLRWLTGVICVLGLLAASALGLALMR